MQRHLVFREIDHNGPLVAGYWFTDDFSLCGALHGNFLILTGVAISWTAIPVSLLPWILIPLAVVIIGPLIIVGIRVLRYRRRKHEIKALVREWCKRETQMEEADVLCEGRYEDIDQALPGFTPRPIASTRVWIPARCRVVLHLVVGLLGVSLLTRVSPDLLLKVALVAFAVAATWQTLRIKECRVIGETLRVRCGWRLPGVRVRTLTINVANTTLFCFFPDQ